MLVIKIVLLTEIGQFVESEKQARFPRLGVKIISTKGSLNFK